MHNYHLNEMIVVVVVSAIAFRMFYFRFCRLIGLIIISIQGLWQS